MTDFAGLDVSLRSTHVCIIGNDGELYTKGKTNSEVADKTSFLDESMRHEAKILACR